MAKGNLAFSVGLMVLLMVMTVLYMPLMLPLLLRGVTVNPWDIARPLIFLMLLPLAAALFVKARYAQRADSLAPYLAKASNIALVLLVAAGLLANLDSLLGIIGTTAILAGLIFLAACFVIGFLFGGSRKLSARCSVWEPPSATCQQLWSWLQPILPKTQILS